MKLVRVALAVPLFQFFDYSLPTELCPVIGGRVVVPFGTQKRVGIVVEFPKQSEVSVTQLKPIHEVLDKQGLFNESIWALLHWAANYYQAPMGEALFQALPVKLRQGESAEEKSRIFFQITESGREALLSQQLKRAKKQQEALQFLIKAPLEKGQNAFTSQLWHNLKEKGYVAEYEQHNEFQSWQQKLTQPLVNESNKHRLNKEQALALGRILFHQGFAVWLIDGVTGSGKTEIYLQSIEETLKKGKQVLVLVPEIGLTPQTVQRFKARFNVEIDILHSNLNDTQRLQVWLRAKSDKSAIVIGTRSALFTQFSNLGLIVIDEEHDSSFKQQDGWRYHARDLATVYAKHLDIPVLLGSATPSLESLHNVALGKYQHIVLAKKASNNHSLQQFVIDLKHQRIQNGLSDTLANKMHEHLQQGNQVLLFLNRRGFAPVLFCHECGWIAQCQHCDKPYTYHQHQRALRCHHCASQKPIPMQCGHCGSTHLMTTGVGTEQLEETLVQRFPNYRITRIDRDNTTRKGELEQHLKDIQSGKSQILIGTQMLAKGHHFPNVTLVGLLNVDNALFSVDFRAEERLAQLYIQVSGRAGRSEKRGQVVLQTHYPDHPLLHTLLKDGYGEFARQALHLRQQMGLPPYSSQALFRVQSRRLEDCEIFLQQIMVRLQQKNIVGLQIYGPMAAPFSKKAGFYRWQLLLQHQSRTHLQQVLNSLRSEIPKYSHQVRWILDVDPQDLT